MKRPLFCSIVIGLMAIPGLAAAQQADPGQPPPPPSATATVVIGAPSAPNPQPVYAQPQPQPVYAQPQPVYGQPQPVYGQPQPVYGQPVYGQPAYGQPVYAQPVVYGQPRYRRERNGTGLIVGGAVVFGAFYVITLLVASVQLSETSSTANTEGYIDLIPVVGPWINLAGGHDAGVNVLYAIDGIAQTAGLAMLIAGVVIHNSADSGPHASRDGRQDRSLQWAVLPMSGAANVPGVSLAVANF